MLRKCGWCKKELGRKCGRCGSQKVSLLPGGAAYCLSCVWVWALASEAETTTICDSCLQVEREVEHGYIGPAGEAARDSQDDYEEYAQQEIRDRRSRP